MADSGTAAYMAPEVISSDHFNTKADVYAFGILMYEVIGGKRAYDGLLKGKKKLNEFQLKTRIKDGLRPEIDFPMKKGLRRMIEKCWSEDPKERPTFDELFKKLSLSNDDYFLEFEGNYEEPKIITDNDDEEEDDEGLSKLYCLNDVDTNELLDYVDEIKEETKKTAAKENDELRHEIKELRNIIDDQSEVITSLKTELSSMKAQMSQILSHQQRLGNRFFSVELSKEGPGILGQLKEKQKNPFDRLFIVSQSSRDIYNLLLPQSDDSFSTNGNDSFYFEFELEEEVAINGVQIFSSDKDFPKSFDIAVEGETVKSVAEARGLNGQYKDMKICFPTTRGRKVRFTQTGPNWDQGTNFLIIKGIEILSSEAKYSKGVFATLVAESENKDPHKCPVIISAHNFDFNSFHSLGTEDYISTYPKGNSWFQVELTRGTAILNGFRLKRCNSGKLRSYKLICTDDPSKPESSWTKLIEISEKTKDENELLDIYEFPHPSPPTRFVRLVQTGKNWSDNIRLKFYHFDLFGSYF